MTKTEHIHVRVSEEEKERIVFYAKARGTGVTQFLLDLVEGEIGESRIGKPKVAWSAKTNAPLLCKHGFRPDLCKHEACRRAK